MRQLSRALLAVGALLLAGGQAGAEDATPTPTSTSTSARAEGPPPGPVFAVFGVKYGLVAGWGGSLGVGYDRGPAERRRGDAGTVSGPLVALEATQGGLATHVGYIWGSPAYGALSTRAVFLRSRERPRVLRGGESYGGAELKVMFLGFNAFVSGYRRLGSGGRGPGWAGDAGLGFFF